MSSPRPPAGGPPAAGAAAPADDAVEELVREQMAARGGDFSEQDVAKAKAQVKELIGTEQQPGSIGKLSKGLHDEEVAGEFEQMNFSIGLPGGVALVEALVRNCGIVPARQEQLLETLVVPGGLPRDLVGTIRIEIPARGARSGRNLYLHAGACPANHDLQRELDKVAGVLSEKENERVLNQCAFIVEFVKKAYGSIMQVNPVMASEIIASLGETKVAWGVDEANTTVYLHWNDVRAEPRAGLFITDPDDAAADAPAAGQGIFDMTRSTVPH